MRTVFGVDLVQWRALVQAGLRTDARTTGRALDFSGRTSGGRALIGTLILYLVMGVGMALFVALSSDRLLAATLFLTTLAFLVGSSLLIEYQSVVLSPADYGQLAFRPVTSRTFLAARLTSVCIYVLAITAAFASGPIVAFAVGRTGGPQVALAAAAAAALEALTVTLVVVGLYVSVLRFVPAARLTSALTYLQLAFSFVMYGSLIIAPRLLGREVLLDATLPRTWWLLLNPSSWFAGWITVASGEPEPWDAVAVALSGAALLVSGWFVVGRLSIDYAERLADSADAASHDSRADAGRPLARGRFFRDGEARAVALLLRAQFRYDQRFRLTVLSIVPLTAVYLFAGVGNGNLDPFHPQGGETMVYLAVMLFPPMMRMAMTQSDAYRAAWIFHGTPADKPALVLAVRRLMMLYFVLPYVATLGLVFVALVGRPGGMLVHTLVLALVSHLVLVADVLINPDIPFSRPVARGGRMLATMVSIFVVITAGMFMHVGLRLAYATRPGTLALLGGLAALTLVGEMALRERLRSLSARAEFDL